MELIYAWVEKFRNYKKVELKFSDKFIVNYDDDNKKINIKYNKEYFSIYSESGCITNINAIVGRNGVGKTNLLDLLGLKMDDRNEIETIYKNKSFFNVKHIQNNLVKEVKKAIYFCIYYMGKDKDDNDIFCVEGNDIESYIDLFEYNVDIMLKYRKAKYWFPFVCNYKNNKFIIKYDMSEKIDGDKKESDKVAIISLREKLNKKYYSYSSTKFEDDYKICIPRRVAKFNSMFWGNKIKMLHAELKNSERYMFKNKQYTLKINYIDPYIKNGENKLILSHTSNEITKNRNKNICRVIENFIYYFVYDYILYDYDDQEQQEVVGTINNNMSKISLKDSTLESFKKYYLDVMKCIFKVDTEKNYYGTEDLKDFENMVTELMENKSVYFGNNTLKLKISKEADIDSIIKFVGNTVDVNEKNQSNERGCIFESFFDDITIDDMSDGESAYLGMYASLYEQISMLTPGKSDYIILLDEPEERMHPELARRFVSDLVNFLKDIGKQKKFQIIMSTHSPFILSDIQSENVIYLNKDKYGNCIVTKNRIKTFGANIHELLKDGFFMDSTMGQYAIDEIKSIIKFIKNNEECSGEERQKYLYKIESIGNPLVRNKLLKMFHNYLQEQETVSDLQNKIQKLQERINFLEANNDDKNKNK